MRKKAHRKTIQEKYTRCCKYCAYFKPIKNSPLGLCKAPLPEYITKYLRTLKLQLDIEPPEYKVYTSDGAKCGAYEPNTDMEMPKLQTESKYKIRYIPTPGIDSEDP